MPSSTPDADPTEVLDVYTGDTLEEAMATAVAALGTDLQVRRARKVRSGVRGLMGREVYEVLAAPGPSRTGARRGVPGDGDAVGSALDRLLADADADDSSPAAPPASAGRRIGRRRSTDGPAPAPHAGPPRPPVDLGTAPRGAGAPAAAAVRPAPAPADAAASVTAAPSSTAPRAPEPAPSVQATPAPEPARARRALSPRVTASPRVTPPPRSTPAPEPARSPGASTAPEPAPASRAAAPAAPPGRPAEPAATPTAAAPTARPSTGAAPAASTTAEPAPTGRASGPRSGAPAGPLRRRTAAPARTRAVEGEVLPPLPADPAATRPLVVRSRPASRRPEAPVPHPDPSVAEHALPASARAKAPGWDRRALRRLGVPQAVLAALPQEDPADDLAWVTALTAAISAVVPAPAVVGPEHPVVVDGYGLEGAVGVLQAGAKGATPGTLVLEGRAAPASAVEIALVLRAHVTGG